MQPNRGRFAGSEATPQEAQAAVSSYTSCHRSLSPVTQ